MSSQSPWSSRSDSDSDADASSSQASSSSSSLPRSSTSFTDGSISSLMTPGSSFLAEDQQLSSSSNNDPLNNLQPSSPDPSSSTTNAYLDDDPNFDPNSPGFALMARMQERAWRRQQGIPDIEEEERQFNSSNSSSRRKPLRRETSSQQRQRRLDLDAIDTSSEASSSASEASSGSSYDWQQDEEDASQQLQESIEQLQLIVKVVLCPLFGKWLGRKWAYWAFRRYQAHGFPTPQFFGLASDWRPVSVVPSWLAVLSLPSGGGA